jgi:hypothetical protein
VRTIRIMDSTVTKNTIYYNNNKTEVKNKIFNKMRELGTFQDFRDDYLSVLSKNKIKIDGIFDRAFPLNNWVMYSFFCRMIDYIIPDKKIKIIDWGGGWGQNTGMLRLLGFKNVNNYILYPPCEDSSKIFKRMNISAIYGKNPKHLNIKTGNIDLLISSGVFEHVREDGIGNEEMTLREIYRVLKKGGLFVIWNLPRILSVPDLKNKILGNWYHKFRFQKKQIIDLLKEFNFEILFFDKHKFIPDILYNYIIRKHGIVLACKFDEIISHIFPINIFARDFIIICIKR